MNMFAFRMMRKNKKEEAIALFRLGVEAYQQSAAAMNHLGIHYQEIGQTALARDCFEKALSLLAADPMIQGDEKAQARSNLEQELKQLLQP